MVVGIPGIILPTQIMHYFSEKSLKITIHLHQVSSPQNGSHFMTPVEIPVFFHEKKNVLARFPGSFRAFKECPLHEVPGRL